MKDGSLDTFEWFTVSTLIERSDEELKTLRYRLIKWSKRKRDVRGAEIPNVAVDPSKVLEILVADYALYLQRLRQELYRHVSLDDVSRFVLEVRICLTRLQPIFSGVEIMFEDSGSPILFYPILLQLAISYVGHVHYTLLNRLITDEFLLQIRSGRSPSRELLTVCHIFADISCPSCALDLMAPLWTNDWRTYSPVFVQDIMTSLYNYYKADVLNRALDIDEEFQLDTFLSYMDTAVSNIYPEDKFILLRQGLELIFGDIEFYKRIVFKVLISPPLRVEPKHCRSVEIFDAPLFSRTELHTANVIISTKFLQLLLKNKSKVDLYLLHIFDILAEPSNSFLTAYFQFSLSPSSVPRFMKILVKHVVNFRKAPHHPLHAESMWLHKLTLFLRTTQLLKPFVECFFSSYVLKEIVLNNISIQLVKEALIDGKSSTIRPLPRLSEILKHDPNLLRNVTRLLTHPASRVSEVNDRTSLCLPQRLFPNLPGNGESQVPFALPEKWFNVPSQRTLSSEIPVIYHNEPFLQRVTVKSTVFENCPFLLNLSLVHAVILDSLFNVKTSWNFTEMVENLSVHDVPAFRRHLDVMVKYGLLLFIDGSCYTINVKFRPKSELVINGVLTLL